MPRNDRPEPKLALRTLTIAMVALWALATACNDPKDEPEPAEKGAAESAKEPAEEGASAADKPPTEQPPVVDPDPEPEADKPLETADEGPEKPAEVVLADGSTLEIVPLLHASHYLVWGDVRIVVDPVAGAFDAAGIELANAPKAQLVLLTDIHQDHFDPETVAAIVDEGGEIVAPAIVAETLKRATSLANGATYRALGNKIEVTAVAMYNLKRVTEGGVPFHTKGRGNGYLLELGGSRIYVSGDTECVPEVKALEEIDVALLCMNLPYTMPVEEALECARVFAPKILYPYHYRGQDIAKLAPLETDGIDVRELDWYPEPAPK